MGRPATFFIYVTLALLVLLVLRSHHSPGHRRHLHHRRLKLRSNFSFTSPPPAGEHHIPFDPLIADIEQRREDREWERSHFNILSAPGEEAQPEWEDFVDAEDYINDEDRFNVTSRIVLLFPRIDVDPTDGFLSLQELTEWNLQQSAKEVMHRTEREMEMHDKNRDGFISFAEYEPPSWSRNDNSTFGYDMGWWKEDHFNASDMDGDGLLNKTEFNDFLHPADSDNPKMIKWLCKEEIRERDKDRDGKLSFQEYSNGLFDSLRNIEEVYNHSVASDGAQSNKLFQELDKDNDGFLTEDELMPVIGNIHPSERYYAKQQADYVISQVSKIVVGAYLLQARHASIVLAKIYQKIIAHELRSSGKITLADSMTGKVIDIGKVTKNDYFTIEKADADKDGKLSLNEMIEHPYVFYSSIFNDDDDEDDDLGLHDEFR